MTDPTPLEAARDLIRRGFKPIPIPYRMKKCVRKRWPELRISHDDAPKYFKTTPGNVGVLLGEPSGWLVDVDLDDSRAVELGDTYLPLTGMTWGRASKPRSHRIYRLSKPANSRTWKHAGAKGTMIVELRCTRMQTVAPGSTHPSGERIEWYGDGEPATIDPDDLIHHIEKLVFAASETSSALHTDTKPPKTCRPEVPETQRPTDPIRKLSADEVVRQAMVTGPGQHDTCTFMLARGLKLNAGLSLDQARPCFDQWWAQSQRNCQDGDADAAYFKFARAWGDAVIALNSGGVGALVLSRLETLPRVPEEEGYSPKAAMCIRVLAEMGRLSAGQPFALSAQMIGKALEIGNTTAHDLLWGLDAIRLIRVVDRGRAGANGTGRARRIIWIGKQDSPT